MPDVEQTPDRSRADSPGVVFPAPRAADRSRVADFSAYPPAVAEALAHYPVFDGHNDLPSVLRNEAGYGVEGLDRPTPYHTDLDRLAAGGVGAQFWSAWVPSGLSEPEAVVATLEQIDAIHRLVAAYPGRLRLARTASDVRAAWAKGEIASLIGLEGGHSLAGSLGVLRGLARLGVRYVTLTHNDNTAWADSATAAPAHGGLTDEGRAIVAELNRIGLLVDLSHTSADTQRAALSVSTAPVVFSHSSAHAVNPHPRNVTDDVLAAVAAGGGVVQVTFVPDFVSAAVAEWTAAARAAASSESPSGEGSSGGGFWKPAPRPGQTYQETAARNRAQAGEPALFAALRAYERDHPRPRVTLADVVPHLEHIRQVAGIDHVGLGGDYDGYLYFPEGLEDVSGYPRLLAALAERGWSAGDLAQLTGGNVLRVLQAAEEAATDPIW
ncbi:MAG: dipeptidase [Propionibacteriaceae bacterium]|jgi:membrane dipeptidase|nr:dipeptidase [Propionibacteriaceae bacterium]